MTARFTDTQGQYLAFIHTYRKLHRRAPAETDFQDYFRVTPPTAHRMIVTLTERGLIQRRPGEARTIELLVSPEDLPPLR
jgi:DNA-binding MarR family transcriptional regulator